VVRGRPRSLFYGLVALVVVGSLLAACTSKPSGNSTPHAGGTLDVSIRDLGSLDPARASGRGALLVVSQIFDSLTSIDPVTGLVKPAAASSWTTSSDGLTWRFTLAVATFQNGDPVRARDFKFAFDRVTQKSLRSEIAYELEPVTGFRAARVAGTAKTLAGVSAPSATVLVIKLDHPFYELPYSLADPGLAPIPYSVYGGSTDGLDTAPVGNGPFKVVTSALQSQATLARNDTYSGTKAYLDGMKFHVVSNVDDGWRAFQAHQTDITDVPTSQVASGNGFDQRGFTPVWATLSFGPNLKLAKYQDPNVRIAMSLAIDRAAITSQVFGSTKDAATGLVPRGVRGYIPGACKTCTFDQGRARTLLNASFKGKMPSITIDHLSDQASRLVAQAIAKDLAAVGFHTSLRAHGAAEYLKLLQKGRQDFAELGWVQNVPSPDGFLAQQLLTGSINNQTGFHFGTFDADIANARKEKDEATRLADYAGSERNALALMPLIPIVFYRNREAVASRVQGFRLDGAGIFDASTIWLG
jgi:peptide/nickel transport system substrate-binding protein/oligopeptide transport system substrate-binding protein